MCHDSFTSPPPLPLSRPWTGWSMRCRRRAPTAIVDGNEERVQDGCISEQLHRRPGEKAGTMTSRALGRQFSGACAGHQPQDGADGRISQQCGLMRDFEGPQMTIQQCMRRTSPAGLPHQCAVRGPHTGHVIWPWRSTGRCASACAGHCASVCAVPAGGQRKIRPQKLDTGLT
jgi:hypothetical protein